MKPQSGIAIFPLLSPPLLPSLFSLPSQKGKEKDGPPPQSHSPSPHPTACPQIGPITEEALAADDPRRRRPSRPDRGRICGAGGRGSPDRRLPALHASGEPPRPGFLRFLVLTGVGYQFLVPRAISPSSWFQEPRVLGFLGGDFGWGL